MHRRVPLLMLAVLWGVLAGCAAADRSPAEAPPADAQAEALETRVYEVFGMDCPGCHGGLEKLVLRIPAVQAAKANWERKRLTVTVRPGADLDDGDVREAIRKSNFTLGERLR